MLTELLLLLQTEHTCLSKTIFGEARSEPIVSQLDVALTVLNRVNSPLFPDTICGVTNQPYQYTSRNEFDTNYWFTERVFVGFETTLGERKAKEKSQILATFAMENYKELTNPIIYHYHAAGHNPVWASELTYSHTSGTHLFYTGY